MTYGGVGIDIYPHAKNEQTPLSTASSSNQYYYAPLGLLNYKSAVSSVNTIAISSEKNQMTFDVEMWNDDMKEAVVDWIKQNKDNKVNENLVRITPFEQVALHSASLSDRFTLSNVWTHYKMTKSVTMSLFCHSQSNCELLAQEMRQEPKMFLTLRLLLTVQAHASQTKEIKISVESIRNGDMASKLIQKMEGKDYALTAKDEQQFFSESSTKIIKSSISDSSVISDGSQNEMLDFLKTNLLQPSRITIKEIGDKNWDSVYWNSDNYRPDRTSKALNDVYSKSDKETQKKIVEGWDHANKLGVGAGVSIPGLVAVHSRIDTDFSRAESKTKEDKIKFFNEALNNVEWKGEKFQPKNMILSMLNLAKLSDTQTFQDRSVQLSYSTAVLTVGFHLPQASAGLNKPTDPFTQLQLQVKRSNDDMM